MKLTTKVLLTLTLAILVGMVATAYLAGQAIERSTLGFFSETAQEQLQALADQAASSYKETASWSATQKWLTTVASPIAMPGMGQGMVGRGAMRGQGRMMQGTATSLLLVDAATGQPLASTGDAVGAAVLAAGIPVMVDGQTVARLVSTAATTNLGPREQALLSQMNRAVLWSALLSGLVALVAGGLLVNSILRPLRRVEQAVAQVAQGDLSVRIENAGADEIGRLAVSFNAMAGSLQEQEELRQRLVADIAHELRTPLSVMQGNLQAILDDVYPLNKQEIQTIFDETRLLSRLVSDLHELAQAEAKRLPLVVQTVAVGSALAHMAETFRPLSLQQAVEIEVAETPAALAVRADPDRLQQVLHNLVANALRHTPPGGVVRLSGGRLAGQVVRFVVEDSGPGIAAQDLAHVFDRFYRADRLSRPRNGLTPTGAEEFTSGAGLGLAIVKALVEAQGGAVGVVSSAGKGATFWFELPAAG